MTADTERELIGHARAGDHRAYGQIVNHYQNPLKFFVFKLVNNTEDAEDIVMETFTKAYYNLGSYQPTAKFSTWLYNIAKNRAIDVVRYKNRRGTVELMEGDDVDKGVSPQELLIKKEERQGIDKMLSNLSPTYRSALERYYLQDLTHGEISDTYHVSVDTSKTRVFRGIRAIRRNVKIHVKK